MRDLEAAFVCVRENAAGDSLAVTNFLSEDDLYLPAPQPPGAPPGRERPLVKLACSNRATCKRGHFAVSVKGKHVTRTDHFVYVPYNTESDEDRQAAQELLVAHPDEWTRPEGPCPDAIHTCLEIHTLLRWEQPAGSGSLPDLQVRVAAAAHAAAGAAEDEAPHIAAAKAAAVAAEAAYKEAHDVPAAVEHDPPVVHRLAVGRMYELEAVPGPHFEMGYCDGSLQRRKRYPTLLRKRHGDEGYNYAVFVDQIECAMVSAGEDRRHPDFFVPVQKNSMTG